MCRSITCRLGSVAALVVLCGGAARAANDPPVYDPQALGNDFKAQRALARRMEAELAKTSLPAAIKKAPTKILQQAEREAQATRQVWGKVWGRGTDYGTTRRMELGDPARTVTSSATFQEQPSYGFSVAQQHLGVVNNARPSQAGVILPKVVDHNGGATIEMHSKSGPGGWKHGISDVGVTRSRLHGDGSNRWFNTDALQLADGRWLMTRQYQRAQTDPRSGAILSAPSPVKRYYVVGKDGKRTAITPEQREQLFTQYLDGLR